MIKQKNPQKNKINYRPASYIKDDKIQQKIYNENAKFLAEMFLNYAKK